jgi:hypothetical protein
MNAYGVRSLAERFHCHPPGCMALRSAQRAGRCHQSGDHELVRNNLLSHWSRTSNPLAM